MLEQFRATLSTPAGAQEGTFRAVASHLKSIVHGAKGPTRFEQGAFREHLGRHPLLWQHNDSEVIGYGDFSEGPEGLMVDATLALKTTRGAEAYELLKMGALTDVSIGFTVGKHKMEKHGKEQIRVVQQAELGEVSLVTWGADKNAKVRTVHSALQLSNYAFEKLVAEMQQEQQEGKVFSEGSLTKLRLALGALVELVQKVDPGHIAAVGRRAAQILKKSIVLVDKKDRKAKVGAYRHAQLRRLEMLAAGMSVEDLPLVTMPDTPPPYQPDPEFLLLDVLRAIGSLQKDARRPLFAQAVKQYLVMCGEADEADTEEDADPQPKLEAAAE